MTAVPNSPDPYLSPMLASVGTPLQSGPNGWTLANAATYYIPIGGIDSLIQSVQIDWDASVVMVATVEDSNHPTATDYSTSTREWTPNNPTSAYVGVVGGTSAAATVTVPGGTAGSAMFHVGNTGALRNRIKLVVTTGGNANAKAHGKK